MSALESRSMNTLEIRLAERDAMVRCARSLMHMVSSTAQPNQETIKLKVRVS